VQKNFQLLPIEDDPSLLAELSQQIVQHLECCSHQQLRGPRNLCTLEIKLPDNSNAAADARLVLNEFLQQMLRNTDLVLKTDRHTWLTVLHCLPTDLPCLMKRLQAGWHRHAESNPLRHSSELSFQSGISFEPTVSHAELSAALLQYYHPRRKSEPTLS
jgi:hypothetical protein